MLRMLKLCARCKRNEETHKHFMAKIPGSLSISKVIGKETHDILVIQRIKLFDGIGECIHHPVHLLLFFIVIDVSPWRISTSNTVMRCIIASNSYCRELETSSRCLH